MFDKHELREAYLNGLGAPHTARESMSNDEHKAWDAVVLAATLQAGNPEAKALSPGQFLSQLLPQLKLSAGAWRDALDAIARLANAAAWKLESEQRKQAERDAREAKEKEEYAAREQGGVAPRSRKSR